MIIWNGNDCLGDIIGVIFLVIIGSVIASL